MKLNELGLFAGCGGGLLASRLLGWKTVCAVERDAYAASVLAQRQNDGLLEPFPIWSDVTSFDGRRWRGIIDVVSGGFPCQDISVINRNAQGLSGARSGLWSHMPDCLFSELLIRLRDTFVWLFSSSSRIALSRRIAIIHEA